MKFQIYTESPNRHIAQIIRDNGGALIERCGATPKEALERLNSAVQQEALLWAAAVLEVPDADYNDKAGISTD